MSKPLISIVTPSFNHGEFIEENIKSVMRQDYENIEHIVIDGGSTDATLEILRQFDGKYNLDWVSESDRGQSHAINKGIKKADGEWIGWQNSDDIYTPHAFTTLSNYIDAHDGYDVFYGDKKLVNRMGDDIGNRYFTTPSKYIHKYRSIFAPNQSLFFHRSIFEKVGYLNEDYKYGMDVEFLWRILNSELKAKHIPEILGAQRLHEDTKTTVDPAGMSEERWRVYGNQPQFIPARAALSVGLQAMYMLKEGVSGDAPLMRQLSAIMNEFNVAAGQLFDNSQ